jgi:hypothetical protein
VFISIDLELLILQTNKLIYALVKSGVQRSPCHQIICKLKMPTGYVNDTTARASKRCRKESGEAASAFGHSHPFMSCLFYY